MKEKKLLPLYLSHSLRNAAVSLISFFSAVFIFKKYLQIAGNQRQAYLMVFAFFLILTFAKTIGLFLAQQLALKFGLKAQMILGNFLTALCFVSFYLSKTEPFFLWLAAIYWGLAIGFFWFGRHGLIINLSYHQRFGQVLGTSLTFDTAFNLFLPLLGGVIITEFGYNTLFLVSLLLVLLSMMVFTPLEDKALNGETTLGEIIKLYLTHKRMALAYLSIGFLDAVYSEGLIIFVFLNIKKEIHLGIFLTLSMILTAMFCYYVCVRLDRESKKKFIVPGSLIYCFAWIGRFFSQTYLPLFVFDVIGGIGGALVGYPMEILSYQKAVEGKSASRAILFRELAIASGTVLGLLLLTYLIVLRLSIRYAFMLAAVFALFRLLIVKKDGILGE